MRVLGIDPGLSGALALIDTKKRTIDVLDMPITAYGKSKYVNAAIIGDWIEEKRPKHVVIEQVQSFGHEARGGLFRFGASFGAVVGCVQTMLIPHSLVTPPVWKRKHGLIGKSKEASHAMACRLFPKHSRLFEGPRGGLLIDRAEAVLIADYYCRC